jgi:hypothetical protein
LIKKKPTYLRQGMGQIRRNDSTKPSGDEEAQPNALPFYICPLADTVLSSR